MTCLQKERTKERNTTHGLSRTKIYLVWGGMINRCHNTNSKDYKHYGGRGIKVCKRWHKFEDFYKDMGDTSEGLTLERINNNKGYNKKNCKWATRKEQNNNQRPCKGKNYIIISPKGKESTINNLSKFCEKYNLDPSSMVKISKDKRNQHKGWKCYYV